MSRPSLKKIETPIARLRRPPKGRTRSARQQETGLHRWEGRKGRGGAGAGSKTIHKKTSKGVAAATDAAAAEAGAPRQKFNQKL